jgi:hypothetical protein
VNTHTVEAGIVLGAQVPSNGDVDCDNTASPIDALKLLRYASTYAVTQVEPCADIGSVIPADPENNLVGDVDCSTLVNSVDALKVLRYSVELAYTQTEPCEDISAPPY